MDTDLIHSSIILNNEKSILEQAIDTVDVMYIEQVKQLKLEILKGVDNPSGIELVQPEIIDSWLRSLAYGVDVMQSPRLSPVISKDELDNLCCENRILINTTLSSLSQFQPMLHANYDIILTDPNGVNLITMLGETNKISHDRFNLIPGSVWNEKTIGTSAMSLAPILKKPVQVCGPEVYLDDFKNVASSSAPIFDIKGNLAGVLSIGTIYYQCVNSFNLSLAASIASLIQKEFLLTWYKEMGKVTNEVIDDALIAVDNRGSIIYGNQAAISLFRGVSSNLIGHSLIDLFGDQPKLMKALKSDHSLSDYDIIIPKLGPYQCSIRSIKNDGDNQFGRLIVLKRGQKAQINTDSDPFANIIGSSSAIRKSISLTRRFAERESNILLQGESGTGKELFASAIHNVCRPNRPFVVVNCGAIPKNLAESELFGYEGGAFTGAKRYGRQGKIESANNGTLFMDEIGDLPLELQPILLRVLEEKQIVRVGGNHSIPSDFQLIAATNKDLLDMVRKDQFREDLYYRLAVFKIVIPPLRERDQDIMLLSDYFLSCLAQKHEIPNLKLTRAAKTALSNYSWPGNVRQLKSCLIYAASIASNGTIYPEHLPEEIRCTFVPSEEISVSHSEKEIIRQALQTSDHNVSNAARTLGISRATLYRKIKKYGL